MLSLLEHRRERYLTIIDNIDKDVISAYVLDYAQQEGIDLRTFIELAEGWLERTGGAYPFSFELSRLGLTTTTRKIYKTFDLAYVTRLVGRPFALDMSTPTKIRRRRAAKIPAGVEVKPKGLVYQFQPVQ